ncbi:DoxX family protein [Modestobacter excelsi]|uniref:DoxX family protein n=1 Tax=Modestobacter excelsi TaxID=2213161 RepID=UPI0024831E47|nr:DoxX family protein [Modestobacter excelsi]
MAGADGILIWLWLEPLGISAAIGLVLHFLGALIGHLRVGDTRGAAAPVVPLLLAIAVLALRLLTL